MPPAFKSIGVVCVMSAVESLTCCLLLNTQAWLTSKPNWQNWDYDVTMGLVWLTGCHSLKFPGTNCDEMIRADL